MASLTAPHETSSSTQSSPLAKKMSDSKDVEEDAVACVVAMVEDTGTPLLATETVQSEPESRSSEPVGSSSTVPTVESGLDDPEDVTSRAAVALAAVAAAATANNSSPSAAAEAARALAPGIAPEASVLSYSSNPIRKRGVTDVETSQVKFQLLERTKETCAPTCDRWSSPQSSKSSGRNVLNDHLATTLIIRKLAMGENDALLCYLLVMSYFSGRDEEDCQRSGFTAASVETGDAGHEQIEKCKMETAKDTSEAEESEITSQACDMICSIVPMITDAYNRLLRPQPSTPLEEADDKDTMNSAAPFVQKTVEGPRRDATLEFFWACHRDFSEQKSLDTVPGNAAKQGSSVNGEFFKTIARPSSTPSSAAAAQKPAPAVPETASSVLSSVFSSVKRSTKSSPGRQSTLAAVFRKRTRLQLGSSSGKNIGEADETPTDSNASQAKVRGEYMVQIDREMLGLTVENVLERTVVRTVLPGGAAKKAGAKVGSLIVKVGNVETRNLTHFETIDELRQSQRPLKLVLRQISSVSLQAAREEMGRLIRGGGFGVCRNEDRRVGWCNEGHSSTNAHGIKVPEHAPSEFGAFSEFLRARWNNSFFEDQSLKDESVARAGEKLVWILTMLVAGLEQESADLAARELAELPAVTEDDTIDTGFGLDQSACLQQENQNHNSHDSKDYADASRSVSKVLHDFCRERLDRHDTEPVTRSEDCPDGSAGPSLAGRRGSRKTPSADSSAVRSTSSGRTSIGRPFSSFQGGAQQPSLLCESSTKSLLRIGDVLHRTRTFFADTNSPPAALLRGEVISFLCDVLDIDTEMELSEEEAASSIAGHKAGPINDLGSAGSLLKLIILNCSTTPDTMTFGESPHDTAVCLDEDPVDDRGCGPELGRSLCVSDLYTSHAGNRFMAVVHRLAASRSTSARVTACSLGPVLWGHLDFPHQLQLRGVITRALHDAEVIVRKSTATVLHEIAELVFDPRAVPWLVLMCERVMTDPEPQLRAAAMTLTWHLAEHLPNAFLGDASKGSRSLRRLPPRSDPTFSEVYLLQCKLLPVATRLADDRAPSVRLAVAAQCDRLCNALGDHWSSVIIDLLQALLADSDERVRGEAILCVPRLVEMVLVSSSPDAIPTGGVGVLEALLPVSIKLIRDPSASVRVSLATSAGELLTLLVGLESLEEISSPASGDTVADLGVGYRRHKKHVDETLIPLVQKLLHDPDPEVTSSALRAVTNASRGNVREIRTRRNSTASAEDDTVSLSSYHSHASAEKKEPVFIPVLSETQVLRLLPTLSDLANSRQWRVRQSAVEIVPALLGCTHRLQTRSEIAQLCVRLMGDTVDAVRRTAAECLCLGGGSLGSLGEDISGEWISAIVLPHLRKCSKSDDPKQRMLSLKMAEVVLLNGVCPSRSTAGSGDEAGDRFQKSPVEELVEIATSLSQDRTVNVRLNVGRVLGNIVHLVEEHELRSVTKALLEQIQAEQKRRGGGDRDVLYFAKQAICRARMRLEDATLQEGGN